MRFKLIILIANISICSLLFSTTWHIKLDGTGNFITIQAGINASSHSDTVLVYPGTYYENINYNGKNITVASLELTTGNSQYISQTTLDGQRLTSCVSIIYGETNATLRGLTITNGQGESDNPFYGGGISIYGDYPDMIECDIINCVFTNNFSINSSAGLKIKDGIIFLSGCSIRQNYAARFGGGVGIGGHSQVTFDPINRCSIYNNFAGSGVDMFVETIHYNYQDVYVDTFTVAEPDRYFAQVFPGNDQFTYNFDILNAYIEPIDDDLYVSPFGDDNNSGLNPYEPLKTINLAVRNISSNPDSPHTVFLAEGTYNHSDNQQIFAFGSKAYVNIIGEDMNTTIIDGEFENHPFFMTASDYHNSTIKNITFKNGIYYYSFVMIYYSDNIRFENVTIQDCIITYRGAGFLSATSGGNVELINVTVDNIETQDGGNAGAWINETTSFKAVNCTFSNNTSTGSTAFSAGLYVMSSGDITVENCRFFNNTATGNTWYGYASALITTDYNDQIGNTYIHNNIFYNNQINNGRCTYYASSVPTSTIEFTNNTVVNNISDYGCGFKGNAYCQNNIMRNPGNYEIGLFYDTVFNIPANLYASYNNIEGGESAIYSNHGANVVNWLEGNLDEDSQFLLSGDDPYQLTELSPCIDSGTPDTTGFYLPPWDLLYNERIWDGDGNGESIIDMGCYEYGSALASGYIAGHVLNTNAEFVENAEIIAGEYSTYTNEVGAYFLEVIVGTYEVICYHEGYNISVANGVIVNLGETTMVNFMLVPSVNTEEILQIKEIKLSNYPNPFNPETTISFNLPEAGQVTLEIFNIKGQKVKTLANNYFENSSHSIIWQGEDDNNKNVSSGVYYYKLTTSSKTLIKRMLLLK